MNRNRLKTCRSSIVEGEKQELLTHTVELEYMCSSLISSVAFKQRGETETLWSAGAALSLDSLLYDCGGSQTGKTHRIGRPTARSRTTTDCLEENQGAARRLRVLFLRGVCMFSREEAGIGDGWIIFEVFFKNASNAIFNNCS